jgi:hypothetical protein
MFKAFLFVFGGTAVIYYWSFGNHHMFKLPTVADVKSQYEIKKIQDENVKLKLEIKKLEFTLARLQEATQLLENQDRAIASEKATVKFEIFPSQKNVEDHVKQEVYHWSPGKLLSLAEKEFNLKNYLASAQYGMTLLNQNHDPSLVDEHFYYRLGVSCVESKLYLYEGVEILNQLIKKYPESPLIVQAKLWRGLAFHRLNNQTEFIAMIEEFKSKYRNTKEWTVLKNIYERSIASGNENFVLKDKNHKNKESQSAQEGKHE